MYVSIRQLFTDFSEFVHIATTPSVWLPTHGTADCLPTRKKIKLAAHARCSRLSKILKWLDPSIFTLLYKATIYWISECSNCVRGPSPMCASSNFSLDHYTKLNCGPRMQWLRSWSVTNVRKLTKKITNVRKLTKKTIHGPRVERLRSWSVTSVRKLWTSLAPPILFFIFLYN